MHPEDGRGQAALIETFLIGIYYLPCNSTVVHRQPVVLDYFNNPARTKLGNSLRILSLMCQFKGLNTHSCITVLGIKGGIKFTNMTSPGTIVQLYRRD